MNTMIAIAGTGYVGLYNHDVFNSLLFNFFIINILSYLLYLQNL